MHKNATDDEVHKYNEKLEAAKPKAVRHLILIRHGQYNLDGLTDDQRYLTEIGNSDIFAKNFIVISLYNLKVKLRPT